jgi:hypothetical protein
MSAHFYARLTLELIHKDEKNKKDNGVVNDQGDDIIDVSEENDKLIYCDFESVENFNNYFDDEVNNILLKIFFETETNTVPKNFTIEFISTSPTGSPISSSEQEKLFLSKEFNVYKIPLIY